MMDPSEAKAAEDVYTLAYKVGGKWILATEFFETFEEAFDQWVDDRVDQMLGDAFKTFFGGVPAEDAIVVSMTRGSAEKVKSAHRP